MARRSALLFLGLGGVALVATGCSSSQSSSTPASESPTAAVPEPTVTVTEQPTEAAKPTTPASGETKVVLPPPLSGAKKLSGATKGDSEYARYSIDMPPKQVVNKYKQEAKSEGYTIKTSGGGGGGWGGWGGADYGMTAQKSGSWLDVQAGGESGSTTYFEVCVGAKGGAAMRHCEDRSNEDSRSSGS